MARWAGRIAAPGALAALLWAGGGAPAWQASAVLHALALAGLAGAGISTLRRSGLLRLPGAFSVGFAGNEEPRSCGRMSALPGAALILLLAVLVASSLQAQYRAMALRSLEVWLGLAGWVYLAARAAGEASRLRRLVSWLTGFGAAACLVAAVDLAARGGTYPGLPFENPNRLGALAAAVFPLPIALSVADARRRWTWLLLAVPALVGVGISRSTAALVALVAGALALAAGLVVGSRRGRADLASGLAAAILILASLCGPVLAGGSSVAEHSGIAGVARPAEPGDPSGKSRPALHLARLRALLSGRPDVTMAARLRYARATLVALRDEPLLGFGPGSVPLTFARYRLQVPGASPWGEAVGQLHAVGLQRVYEAGFAGFAVFATWVLLCVVGRPVEDRSRSWLRAGLAAAAAALAVAGASDALEPAPALVAFGALVLALLSARREERAAERLPRRLLTVAGGAILLVALAAAVDMLRVDRAHRRADHAVERVRASGFDGAALDDLRAAARLDRPVGLYEHQAAYAAEEMALDRQGRGDTEGARALFDEAGRLHRDAVWRFPDVPGFATQAGSFFLDRGLASDAIEYLRGGLALDYYDPLAHFYLGEARRLAGREEEAVEEYALAIRFYPRLSRARLWSEPGSAGLRRRVLERVRKMLIEESSRPAQGSAAADLRKEVERLLHTPPQAEAGGMTSLVLVHRLDAVETLSRARHLFGRRGFAIENLPVVVLELPGAGEEERWARVLDGLPALTASQLGARAAERGAAGRGRSETIQPALKRGRRAAGVATEGAQES